MDRIEKSSARNRREKENSEFADLARLLPLPYAITCQGGSWKLDKASVVRLTSSYLSLRRMFPHGFKSYFDEDDGFSEVESNRQIHEMASHLMHTLDGFVFILSSDATIMYISETASVQLGLSQVELTGNCMFDYIHDQDRSDLVNILAGTSIGWNQTDQSIMKMEQMFFLRMKCVLAKRNAGLTESGYKVIHCSGYSRFRKVTCSSSTMSNNFDGEKTVDCLGLLALGFAVPPTAITEIRLSPFMFMFRASLDLRIVFLDTRVNDLTGFDAQQLLDQTLYNMTHVCDMATIRTAHEALLNKHQVSTGYYRLLTARSGWAWVQTQLTLIHIPRSSRPNCIVGVTSVFSTAEQDGLVVDQLQVGSVRNCDSIDKQQQVLGAYSESFYGRNGIMLVNGEETDRTCASKKYARCLL